MGWSTGWSSKSALVKELLSSWDSAKGLNHSVAHCVRGNCLWDVRQYGTNEQDRFINLALLSSEKGDWGYNGMGESMHPYYYNCPLKYLDMTPVACEEWRVEVRKYHSSALKLKVGMTFKQKESGGWKVYGQRITTISVASIRPLRGYADGWRTKLNRRMFQDFEVISG